MDLLITVILLLVCILISNIVGHYMPSVPVSLIQISFGIVIALVFKHISFNIETEWFLLLFAAPLLYNDGRHFPRAELWKLRGAIIGNAILLVLLTTIGGGYFIHWLIPSIPLPAAFALAAILSPTDPVAVNGIAKRIRLPDKILHLVRGESLINDATGLISFKYAIAAVVTGYFSLKNAIFDFTYMFLGGVVLGLVLGFLTTGIRFILRKQGIHDAAFLSLLQVITPFIIFIVTEEFLHASGVIAVVIAGIVHALVKEHTETLIAEEQMLTENIWTVVSFVLNGIVFLLLGLNIPSSMSEAVASPDIGNSLIIGYAFAVAAAILGIRFVWSHLYAYYEYRREPSPDAAKPSLKKTLITSLVGVRGALTMAGVLSIPYVIVGGEPFPERPLILFLAAAVILLTILAAAIFLPLLSNKPADEAGAEKRMDINEAKQKLLLSTLKRLRLEINDENEAAAHELIHEYKFMYHTLIPRQTNDYQQRINEIRLLALRSERKYIHSEMEKGAMAPDVFEDLEKYVDIREEALANNVRSGTTYLIKKIFMGWKRGRRSGSKNREAGITKRHAGLEIQIKALQAALQSLEQYAGERDADEPINVVKNDYQRMISRLTKPQAQFIEKKQEQKEELRLKVMDIERSEIRGMFESGEISREQARELRRFLNSIESVTLYEHVE
ncbi:Na+/H+ antiporter [Paenibacillus hamazuiensis]|uniref:Na+/H+ antiporter n=1 Tax=Paenibacillus hamazuiensis TaxID=2936508 RepID=UPI00200EB489|nr:Na+/H+ antiporter [Paenibacillus hamazuiensis]